MSELVPDPTDPSIWMISNATDEVLGAQAGPTTLTHVHPHSECAGGFCVVHNPSDHHMRSWRLNWRADRGLMERICPHGIGHPDPDSLAFHVRNDREYFAIHGCDGCCREPNQPIPA